MTETDVKAVKIYLDGDRLYIVGASGIFEISDAHVASNYLVGLYVRDALGLPEMGE